MLRSDDEGEAILTPVTRRAEKLMVGVVLDVGTALADYTFQIESCGDGWVARGYDPRCV